MKLVTMLSGLISQIFFDINHDEIFFSASMSPKNVQQAQRYISKKCRVMKNLVSVHGGCSLYGGDADPFATLVWSIIGQQLSAKAAATIQGRVQKIVKDMTPQRFCKVSADRLKTAGLSAPKIRYIKELAARVKDGRLTFDTLAKMTDAEVIAALTEVPGIGRWTAEMFLIFSLNRPDVLSLGDAGLQRAVRMLYGEDAALEDVSRTWHPYCSVASWYLWRHLD